MSDSECGIVCTVKSIALVLLVYHGVLLCVHLLRVVKKRRTASLAAPIDIARENYNRLYALRQNNVQRWHAWNYELLEWSSSLKPEETELLQKFLRKHESFQIICFQRPVTFVPRFRISVFVDDMYERHCFCAHLVRGPIACRRCAETGQTPQPSMYEVITAVLAEFKNRCALFPMRKKFVEDVLSFRLNDDCAQLIVDKLF